MDALKQLLEFLTPSTRLDVKAAALHQVLGITGTAEGRELLLSSPEALQLLVTLMSGSSAPIAEKAALSIINLTGDEPGANAYMIIAESTQTNLHLEQCHNLIQVCLKSIMNKDSPIADPCCMILSNVTRSLHLVDRVIVLIEASGYSWDSIIAAFTAKQFNTNGAKLHYLGPVFSNLSQSPLVRRYIMDKDRSVIQRLLPFTEYSESNIRRGGIIATLKNCCFDVENHEWLLSSEVDILSHLLLPLAGPEEFDEEDNDKLPINLQYLPENKQRETDPDIRIMLLEALMQLCATKKGREYLRSKNAYIILRELHKAEKDKNVLLECEKVVDILIKKEEEIGLDNLKDVEVPEEYKKKFNKIDEEYINT
ncbi:protein HGH1 homolog [Prorops nasuta]|uniref:protein HGH1 homolog n=1 Tax=Prorops nasuta TaxID=863751 RepID=UPI0034CE5D43